MFKSLSKGLLIREFSPCVLLLVAALGRVSRAEETRYVIIQRALLHYRNDLRTDLLVLQNRSAGPLELLYQLFHRYRRVSVLLFVLQLAAVPWLVTDLMVDYVVVALAVEMSLRPRVPLVVVACVVKIGRPPWRLIIAVVVVVSVPATVISDSATASDTGAIVVSGFESDTPGLLDDGRSGLVQGEVGVRADRDLPQVDLFYLARVTASVGVAVRSVSVCNARIVSEAATASTAIARCLVIGSRGETPFGEINRYTCILYRRKRDRKYEKYD